MSVASAEWIVALLGIYLGLGVVFALAFVIWGVARIDPAAQGMPFFARLLVMPGVAALWPLMLAKWLGQRGPGT